MDFDESQRAVLALASGRHKVLAPPGSGKTELLAHRARAAVERGVAPSRMACLTFTNRAARVMKERMPPNCAGVFVGNFHAFCLRFLRREGLFPSGGAVLDEEDAHLFISDAVDQTLDGMPAGRRMELLQRFGRQDLVALSKGYAAVALRQGLRLSQEVIAEAERMPGGFDANPSRLAANDPGLARFLDDCGAAYREIKDRCLAIDFEDILALSDGRLAARRGEGAAAPLSWVQVDEAQDLNAIQWSILELLTDELSHVLVLGDVQQSIFSFMGASLDRLHRRTAGYAAHALQTNYRCPAYLLSFLAEYSRRALRIPVSIDAANGERVAGKAMRMLRFSSDGEEHRAIARSIIPRLREKGSSSIAVLARTNAVALEISARLDDAGEGHFLVSSYDLFRTANAKDFLALLTVLWRPANRIGWMRMLRLLGAARTLKAARELVNELFEVGLEPASLLFESGPPASTAIPKRHERALDRLRRGLLPLMRTLRSMAEEPVGFSRLFDVFAGRVRECCAGYRFDHEEDIREKLLTHMEATCPPAPLASLLGRHLPRYLSSREPDLILDGERLVVSTVHRAKGLEFDAVVVPHAVEGTYPFHHAIESRDPARIAEEARILYVAMSRARRKLVITGHECSRGRGPPRPRRPTRFLAGLEGHFVRR